MTSEEIVKSLRCCAVYNGVLCNELGCKLVDKGTGVCRDILEFTAAELIERLEKEKAALLEIAKARPICATCKHHIGCKAVELADCRRCIRRKDCVCTQCVGWAKWEWKGLVENK